MQQVISRLQQDFEVTTQPRPESSFVCLFVCEQHNSKTYGWILIKFSGYVRNGKKKLLDFGSDSDHCLDLLDP